MGRRFALLYVTLLSAACAPARLSPTARVEDRESPVTQVTGGSSGQDRDPELSPDGGLLYYASSSYGSSFDLYVRTIGSNTATRLTSLPGNERFPKVCPANPRVIAFSYDGEGESALCLMDVDRPSKIERITESGTSCIHPSWSPDGRLLVYSAADEGTGTWTLRIREMQTGRTHALDDLDGLLPEWSPVGNRIVFQRMRGRDDWLGSLWTFEWDGGAARNVTSVFSSDDWAAINPCWSPDGRWIAFTSVGKSPDRRGILDRGDDLWAVRSDGSHATRLTTSGAADWMPTWSTEGTLYFVSDRSGSHRIWSLMPRGLQAP